MPRACTACTHKRRSEIDAALVSSEPNRRIAARYRLAEASVRRHRAHVGAAVKRAAEVRQAEAAETVLERLKAVQRDTLDVVREARRTKDREVQLRAIARVERQLELEAKLLGELPAPGEITEAVLQRITEEQALRIPAVIRTMRNVRAELTSWPDAIAHLDRTLGTPEAPPAPPRLPASQSQEVTP